MNIHIDFQKNLGYTIILMFIASLVKLAISVKYGYTRINIQKSRLLERFIEKQSFRMVSLRI